MSRITISCPACGRRLVAPFSDSGKSAPCPNCDNILTIPYVGLKRWQFWLSKAGAFVGSTILAAGMGDGAILLLPPFLILTVYLAYLRAINIGLKPVWATCALIPGSILYFGTAPTGGARRGGKRHSKH